MILFKYYLVLELVAEQCGTELTSVVLSAWVPVSVRTHFQLTSMASWGSLFILSIPKKF